MKLWHKIPGTRMPGPIPLKIRWNRLRYHLTGSLGRWTQEDVDRHRESGRKHAERLRGLFDE